MNGKPLDKLQEGDFNYDEPGVNTLGDFAQGIRENIPKVEGEVVDKSYEDIVEEVTRKLQDFCYRAHVTSKELVVLMPQKDYDTLKRTVLDYLICMDRSKGYPNILGAELKPCGVDKIYVAYDEPGR